MVKDLAQHPAIDKECVRNAQHCILYVIYTKLQH